jgi:hypothetical protein
VSDTRRKPKSGAKAIDPGAGTMDRVSEDMNDMTEEEEEDRRDIYRDEPSRLDAGIAIGLVIIVVGFFYWWKG